MAWLRADEHKPDKPGIYPALLCWDTGEGFYPDVAIWDGESWNDKAVVSYWPQAFTTLVEAGIFAAEHDPDW